MKFFDLIEDKDYKCKGEVYLRKGESLYISTSDTVRVYQEIEISPFKLYNMDFEPIINKDALLIYNGGDMLKPGSQKIREEEKIIFQNLGYNVYSAKDNKEINDKTAVNEEENKCLALKIVEQDLEKIIASDVITIEPHENALGTMVELGEIHGIKVAYDMILKWCIDNLPLQYADNFINEFDSKFNKKAVLPYIKELRDTNIPESRWERSYSINQYVRGVCMELSPTGDLMDWEDIVKYLKDLKAGE